MGVIINTAYRVQADLLESESNIKIENGTLHVFDNELKVHLNNEIKNISTSKYKVYTALLTQSGSDESFAIDSGLLTIGVTYMINNPSVESDFTNVGAPNNLSGTYFVATGTTPNNWGTDTGILTYNTGAPVVTVLENTIGNVWFTYNDVGGYGANSNGLFTIGKTFSSIYSQPVDTVGDGVRFALIQYHYPNVNNIGIQTGNSEVNNFDDYLFNTPIEIRVYN